MSHDIGKRAASAKALEYVKPKMTIGLGTGSTARFFIDLLISAFRHGMPLQVVATSKASEMLAQKGELPILDSNQVTSIDLVVDGADEIDEKKRMIKGAGGALVREKIIASMAKEMIVIADRTKLVKKLGAKPLPIEIIPFGAEATKKHLEDLGFFGKWRTNEQKGKFVTDNHNWILDVTLSSLCEHPELDHRKIKDIPGVVDTGFFINLATRIIIGNEDGSTKVIS